MVCFTVGALQAAGFLSVWSNNVRAVGYAALRPASANNSTSWHCCPLYAEASLSICLLHTVCFTEVCLNFSHLQLSWKERTTRLLGSLLAYTCLD